MFYTKSLVTWAMCFTDRHEFGFGGLNTRGIVDGVIFDSFDRCEDQLHDVIKTKLVQLQ